MDYPPGSTVPETGAYQQIDVFGMLTGISEWLREGERLPLAPIGYSWRKVTERK